MIPIIRSDKLIGTLSNAYLVQFLVDNITMSDVRNIFPNFQIEVILEEKGIKQIKITGVIIDAKANSTKD